MRPGRASAACVSWALGALLAWSGCSHGDGSSGTAPGDCPVDRQVSASDAACGAAMGGPMRQIPLPGGGMMCIDKTEVTVGQYQAFLASAVKPPLPMTDPAYARCSAQTTHAPSCMTDPCQGTSCDLPQTCVDQCDAKAFCAWAGKRLCGPIGSAPLALADVNDPTKNQWMNACNSGGRDWPYGATYDGQACNTSDHQPAACGGPAVTSSYPGCQAPAGPYDQVFDLSGNVSEWVDASQDGAMWPDLRCVIMGGSYVHYWGDASCAGATLQWPCDSRNPEFGFRCCSL
jgi:formylglycine-generating enzyme